MRVVLTDVKLARAILDAYEAGAKNARGAVGLRFGDKDIMIDACVWYTNQSNAPTGAQHTCESIGRASRVDMRS